MPPTPGRRSVAALIPETTYGSVVEAQFREAAARRGMRVVAIERYPAGQPQAAVAALAPARSRGASPQADALFLPENRRRPRGRRPGAAGGRLRPAAGQAARHGRLERSRAPSQRRPCRAAGSRRPTTRGFNAFAGRYRARFGADPTRLATLSYDAVSLAAALARTQGSQRFSEGVLTNPSGFAGADGVFRFRADGTNDRALAVQEIRGGGPRSLVSPAPRALPGM